MQSAHTPEINEPSAKKTISVAKVLLTLPQCPLTKEAYLEHLKTLKWYGCCVICEEEHHETDGKHLHAFIKLDKRHSMRYDTAMTFFDPSGYHGSIEFLKTAKDIQRAVRYVMKDGNWIEDNCEAEKIAGNSKERKYDTKRILETDIKQLVEEGAISPGQYMNIYRAQQHWRLISAPSVDLDDCCGEWHWGKAGAGKSHAAREIGKEAGGFYIKAQNKWWDGYQGEPVVILDDLDTTALTHHLKLWADKWRQPGEVKGATVPLNYQKFIVTSNYSIYGLLCKDIRTDGSVDTDLLEALERRFKQVEYTTVYDPTGAEPPAEKRAPILGDSGYGLH